MIYCKESPGKGRGVFSERSFSPGDLIETAPVIVIPESQRELIESTVLDHCVFQWGAAGLELAIALGYGSLYNHSSNPNAFYHRDLENSTVHFVCVTTINENEEILINYHGNQYDSIPIVFEGSRWRSGE
jgi:SET domain-containing protein